MNTQFYDFKANYKNLFDCDKLNNNTNIKQFEAEYRYLLNNLESNSVSIHIKLNLIKHIIEACLLQDIIYNYLQSLAIKNIIDTKCDAPSDYNYTGFEDGKIDRATVTSVLRVTIKILKVIFEITPNNFHTLEHLFDRIDYISTHLNCDAGLMDDIDILMKGKNFYDDFVDGSSDMDGKKQHFDEGFRQLSVIPSLNEIKSSKGLFLRKNITHGPYANVEQYLDIQYRLLREDYVGSLREGVIEYLARQNTQNTDKKLSPNALNIRVYQRVNINDWVIDQQGGIVHRIHIHLNERLNKIRWETSKRLLEGSLVCLTNDNFRTCYFAIVFNRDCRKLRDGVLLVKFINWKDVISLKNTRDFVMVETTAFFEAYRYTLESLKYFNEDNLPFKRHIVYSDNREIARPKYLKDYTTYDFRPLLCNKYEIIDVTRKPGYTIFNEWIREDVEIPEVVQKTYEFSTEFFKNTFVMDTYTWPTAKLMGFDDSQYEALKLALKNELVVIQGPPGTGKTFIGVQIVRMLLHNYKTINVDSAISSLKLNLVNKMAKGKQPKALDNVNNTFGPILIVCYTNHALDQFLMLISKYLNEGVEEIIRIGRRSKEPRLNQCALHNIKTRFKTQRIFPLEIHKQLRKAREDVQCTIEHLEHLRERLQELRQNRFIKFESFRSYFYSDLRYPDSLFDGDIEQFYAVNNKRFRESTVFEDWLGVGYLYESVYRGDIFDALDKYHDFVDALNNSSRVYHHNDEFYGDFIEEIDEITDKMEQVKIDTHSKANIEEKTKDKQDVVLDNIVEEAELLNKQRQIDDDEREKKDIERLFDEKDQKQQKKGANKKKTNDQQNEGSGDLNGKWNLFHRKPMKYQINSIYNGMADRMDENEVRCVDDLWELSPINRVRLYRYFHHKYETNLKDQFELLIEYYDRAVSTYNDKRDDESLYIMRNAKIVGMTTTGAAKNQRLIKKLKPSIVIAEEAAEVFETHIISCLTEACQQLILIGDNEQLRPSPNLYKLEKSYGLNVSLFERLVNNQIPKVRLNLQHRMRPEISVFMKNFYDDLMDHDVVQTYEHINGIEKNIYFINHQNNEKGDSESFTKSNEYEAEYLIRLCDYFLKQNYKPEQITVLVAYGGQLFSIKNKIKDIVTRTDTKFNENISKVLVTPIDNYQGEENAIILLSLVRSNEHKRIGFLSISNRVCVALSRAKKGFYLIGNFKHLADSSKLWSDIYAQAEAKNLISNSLKLCCQNHPDTRTVVEHFNDFDKCPEGGCMEMCNETMTCGHTCTRNCHVLEHSEYKCKEPCNRLYAKCSEAHYCQDLCYVECKPCDYTVEKTLPSCGHLVKMKCSDNPDETKCQVIVETLLSCGHVKKVKCHQLQEFEKQTDDEKKTNLFFDCVVEVEKTFKPCGHTATVKCYKLSRAIDCNEKVLKKIPECGHEIPLSCHLDPASVVSCNALVKIKLNGCEHATDIECCKNTANVLNTMVCKVPINKQLKCEHTVKVDCCQSATEPTCEQTCGKRLICNHACQLKCDLPCYKCTSPCETECSHGKCARPCYELCRPCKKPCTQSCVHQKCTRLCYEPCNTKPCQKPCFKILDCNHMCSSVCSEKCVCARCEQLNENKVYIRLQNCKCIHVLQDLDKHISTCVNKNRYALPTCPKCTTPISTSSRYMNQIKTQQTHYRSFKLKQITNNNILNFRLDLNKEIHNLDETFQDYLFSYTSRIRTNGQLEFVINRLNCIQLYTKAWNLFKRMRKTNIAYFLYGLYEILLSDMEISNDDGECLAGRTLATFYLCKLLSLKRTIMDNKAILIDKLIKDLDVVEFKFDKNYFDRLLLKQNSIESKDLIHLNDIFIPVVSDFF